MAAVAAFLRSDEGRAFAAIQPDVGAAFSDPFVAYNARAAAVYLAAEDAKDEPKDDYDAFKRWVEAHS